MRKLVLFLGSVFLFASISSAQLQMKIAADKNEYTYGDTIHISCSVRNISDTTISFISGTYGSCQAEFYFNDFYSGSQENCLATTEKLLFDPGTEKIYYWTIDPKRYGLPNKDGEQTIIGMYFKGLSDTLKITAPKFYGGQLNVGYPDSLNSEVSLIKDSLNVEVLSSHTFDGNVSETWQITGYSIDSLLNVWNDSANGQLGYVEFNRWTQYDSIITSPSNDFAQFYPLHIGDKWFYEVKQFDTNTNPTISYVLKEIIGDTVMPNNLKYFIVKNGYQTQYERFDSSKGEVRYYTTDCSQNDAPIYSLAYRKDSVRIWQSCDGFTYKIHYELPSTIEQDTTFIHLEGDGLASVDIYIKKYVGITNKIILEGGKVEFNLLGYKINGKQHGILTSIEEDGRLPHKFTLSQNYPNPFNPTTTIKYTIPSNVKGQTSNGTLVQLSIFDVLGREVAILVNKKQKPGNYKVKFDASQLSSGVYFYKLIVYSVQGDVRLSKKMILLK